MHPSRVFEGLKHRVTDWRGRLSGTSHNITTTLGKQPLLQSLLLPLTPKSLLMLPLPGCHAHDIAQQVAVLLLLLLLRSPPPLMLLLLLPK